MNKKRLQLLSLAKNYFKNNSYSLAVPILDGILKESPMCSEANELLGYIYGNQEKFELSFEKLQLACREDKGSPEAYYYLGIVQLKRNETHQAITSFEKAILKGGVFYEALYNLGVAHDDLGNAEKSLAYYRECTKFKKNFETYLNIATCANNLKLHEEAIENYDLAIKLSPDNANVWNGRGTALYGLGRFDDALACYDRAEKLEPEYTEALINKAVTLAKLGKTQEAIEIHDKAIRLEPNNPNAYQSKAVLLGELNQNEEAITNYDHVIKLRPDHTEALLNKGTVLNKIRLYKDALACYDLVIKLKPDYPEVWLNKGVTFEELKRYDDAFACYDRALELRPGYSEAKTNKGVLNLNLKNFKIGWVDYVNRLNHIFIGDTPIWDGIKRCKQLVIISEQGIGDEIFYLSKLTEVEKKVDKVSVMVDKRLISPLSRSFPSITFLERNAFFDNEIYDASIPIGHLLSILQLDPTKSSWKSLPYLKDDKNLTDEIKSVYPFNEKLTCGISWQSSNKKFGNHKSLNLSDLNNILEISDFQFINLQYGEVEKDILKNEIFSGVKLNKVSNIDLFNDIDGLLSVIKACDVVVTTSNVTAHLSGAIGKETFLLLPYSRGRIWYWHDEKISSWYPSVKQFFQDSNLSWVSALEQVKWELENKVAGLASQN